jgi:hypothetical protein
MTGPFLIYTIVLFGTPLPERTVPMDTPEACRSAVQSFLASDFVKNIRDAGGSVSVGCR